MVLPVLLPDICPEVNDFFQKDVEIFSNGVDFFQNGVDFFQNGVDFFQKVVDFWGMNVFGVRW